MVLANSRGIPRVPRYSGSKSRKARPFRLRGSHPLRRGFPAASTTFALCNFPTRPKPGPTPAHDTPHATLSGYARARFRLLPVRSPLLGKSLLFSFPGATKMFQFAPFASRAYGFGTRCRGIARGGFPHSEIRGSKLVRQLPAAYRSFPRPSSPLDAKASTVRPY